MCTALIPIILYVPSTFLEDDENPINDLEHGRCYRSDPNAWLYQQFGPLSWMTLLILTPINSRCFTNQIREGDISLLEPQSRFGDKLLKIWRVCPHNGTAVLKGLCPLIAIKSKNLTTLSKLCSPSWNTSIHSPLTTQRIQGCFATSGPTKSPSNKFSNSFPSPGQNIYSGRWLTDTARKLLPGYVR